MQLKGWMGMFVGPIAGGAAYLKFSRRHGEPLNVTLLVGFIAIGLVAGLLLWGVDALRNSDTIRKNRF